jgi:hypothetical protein
VAERTNLFLASIPPIRHAAKDVFIIFPFLHYSHLPRDTQILSEQSEDSARADQQSAALYKYYIYIN